MITAKQQIFEYIQHIVYTDEKYKKGIQTNAIAEAMNMQRSNVSSILNELLKEGKLSKSATRPVYYQLPMQQPRYSEASCFTKLIGYNGSLRNAVQLAKAAILYPRTSLNVLLSSKIGCGTSFFASLMFEFMKETGTLPIDAKYIKINCRDVLKNVSIVSEDLFGVKGDIKESAFEKAQGGMLFIDGFDLLDALQQSRIFTFLETGMLYSEDKSEFIQLQNVFLVATCTPENMMQIKRKIPIVIELPELKDRPIAERFELINFFLSVEGANSERSIDFTRESMQALLLSEFPSNVKELEIEVKTACAKAYLRIIDEAKKDILICMDDFDTTIKKSLLKLKANALEINSLIGTKDIIHYDKSKGYQGQSLNSSKDMYWEMKKQYEELSNRGVSQSSIKDVINTRIQSLFNKYEYHNHYDDEVNLKELSKIVDQHLIDMIQKWFDETKESLHRKLKSNVFYGLCLHIHYLMLLKHRHRVENDQIVKVIQGYPKEYIASTQLAEQLTSKMGLDMPIEEIVIIAIFLIESDENKEEEHPVLLYIMHGDHTASSLRDVSNTLTQYHNAYSYDLTMMIDAKQAIEEIKALILEINRGPGVVIIYDMGSIKTMIETIAEEIDVKIRYMNIPITLIGIEVARKCQMETDIDFVYHMVNLEVNNIFQAKEKRNDIIITLCHTGEGEAMQLKNYIDLYSKLDMKTIALSMSSREQTTNEILILQKTYRIHAIVGTYDPKLLGIPFISITKVFEHTSKDIDRILMFEPVQSHPFAFDEVYANLEGQLKYTSMAKLKTILPDVMDELSLKYDLSDEQRTGMFVHLACLVERILQGDSTNKNKQKDKLIMTFQEDYRSISKLLSRLEKAFKIIINDDEIAKIIAIVKNI